MILATWSQFRAVFMPGAPIGIDGVEEWDATKVDQVGFSNDLVFPTLNGHPIVTFPYEIEVDASADPTPGLDRYDWYLSQRTDDTTKQYWEVQRNHDNFPTVTNSGKIRLARTSLSTALYPTIGTAALLALFKDLDLYVFRRSDGLIQHRQLEDVLFT